MSDNQKLSKEKIMRSDHDIPIASPVPSRPIDKVSIKQFLFSFKGRINRTTFWLYTLSVFLGTWILYGDILTIPLFLPFFLCIPAWIRRLHDQDKTAEWLLCLGIPVVCNYFSWLEGSQVFILGSFILGILGYSVLLIVCGFLKSTEGSNEYDTYDSLKVKVFRMTIQSFLIFVIVILLSSPLGNILLRILHLLWTPSPSM